MKRNGYEAILSRSCNPPLASRFSHWQISYIFNMIAFILVLVLPEFTSCLVCYSWRVYIWLPVSLLYLFLFLVSLKMRSQSNDLIEFDSFHLLDEFICCTIVWAMRCFIFVYNFNVCFAWLLLDLIFLFIAAFSPCLAQ